MRDGVFVFLQKSSTFLVLLLESSLFIELSRSFSPFFDDMKDQRSAGKSSFLVYEPSGLVNLDKHG